MNKKTIEKKAFEIASKHSNDYSNHYVCKQSAIEIAEWIQEQMIEKAQQWAENWFSNGEEWMRKQEFIDGIKEDIRRTMKEE